MVVSSSSSLLSKTLDELPTEQLLQSFDENEQKLVAGGYAREAAYHRSCYRMEHERVIRLSLFCCLRFQRSPAHYHPRSHRGRRKMRTRSIRDRSGLGSDFHWSPALLMLQSAKQVQPGGYLARRAATSFSSDGAMGWVSITALFTREIARDRSGRLRPFRENLESRSR
jgi:hypothetical protein